MSVQPPQFGSRGYDGVDDAQRITELSRQPKRFFVPKPVKGQPVPEKQIIFVDDNPLCFWEHAPIVNGEKYGNYFPCNQGIWPGDPSCIMCQNRIERYYIGLWTVIDCSEFVFEGKVYKNMKRIVAAKLDSIKLLRQKSQNYGNANRPGLVGKRFLVSRTSQRAARIGNVYDYLRDEDVHRDPKTGALILSDRQYWYTDREGQQHPPTAFNYRETYQALPNAELAAIIGLSMPGHGDVFDRAIQQQQSQQGAQPSGHGGDGGSVQASVSNCVSCGRELPQGFQFCPACGAPQKATSENQPAAGASDTKKESTEAPSQQDPVAYV